MITGDNLVRGKDKFLGPRPICFVYSGVGSQWNTMGCHLMKLDVFKKTFDRCANALRPYDLDLYSLVISKENVFNNIAKCYVAINAVQIALTDVLLSMGIHPDFYLGHSLGEQGK